MSERPKLTVIGVPGPVREATFGPGPRGPRRVRGFLFRVGILVALAVVAAIAIGPALGAPELESSSEWTGKPARSWVRADREYRVFDQEATETAREEVRLRARPVWDFDVERAERDSAAVGKLLRRTQKELEKKEEDARARLAGGLLMLGIEAPEEAEWALLSRLLTADEPRVSAVESALRKALLRPVVGDTQQLARARGTGIIVRPVPSVQSEGIVVNVEKIATVARAKASVAASLTAVLASGDEDTAVAARLADALSAVVQPSLSYNFAESDARRAAAIERVPPVFIDVRRAQVITRPGQVVTRRDGLILRAMRDAQGGGQRLRAAFGAGAFTLLLCGALYFLGLGAVRARPRVRSLAITASAVALQLLVLVAAVHLADKSTELIAAPRLVALVAAPTSLAAWITRGLVGPRLTLFAAALTIILGAAMIDSSSTWLAVAAVPQVAAAAARARRGLLTASLGGLLGGLVGVSIELFHASLAPTDLGLLAIGSALGAVLSFLVATLLTAPMALVFGVVTDRRVRRLADLNHPYFKELVVRAPDEWHRAVRTATLAEGCADVASANSDLIRAVALFHVSKSVRVPEVEEARAQVGEALLRAVEVSVPPRTREGAVVHLAAALTALEHASASDVEGVFQDAWRDGAFSSVSFTTRELDALRAKFTEAIEEEVEG